MEVLKLKTTNSWILFNSLEFVVEKRDWKM